LSAKTGQIILSTQSSSSQKQKALEDVFDKFNE